VRVTAPSLRTLAAFGIFALSGCSTLQPRDFANARSRFEPDRYFTGRTQSWGVFENRAGEPRKRFTTEAVGRRDAAGDLRLTQNFHFDDGGTQQRIWHIRRLDEHRYEATANDVIGKARGEAHGNAFRWNYTVALQPGNPLSHVRLHQWMYQPEGTQTMFTRAFITKAGIRVAQVSESFRRVH
jgi:hypothetical protein